MTCPKVGTKVNSSSQESISLEINRLGQLAKLNLLDTLTVLLVFIIAVALVLPVCTNARNHSKQLLCMTNVNILSRAWLAYAADNDDRIVNGHVPRSASFNDESYWLSWGYEDNAWWVNPPHNEDGIYTGSPLPSLEDEQRGIETGALFDYVGSATIYQCPSNRSYLHQSSTYSRAGKRAFTITALMNGEMNGRDRNNQPFAGTRNILRTGEIVSPAKKCVFLEDLDLRGWNMGSWVMWNSTGWTDPITIFHTDKGTLGFSDGHAEIHRWVDNSTIYNAQDFNVQIDWANGEGADFEYMKRAYVPDIDIGE